MDKLKAFFAKKEITLGGYVLPTKWFYWSGGAVVGLLVLSSIFGNRGPVSFLSLGGASPDYNESAGDYGYGADSDDAMYDDAMYIEEEFYAGEEARALDGDYADTDSFTAPQASSVAVSNGNGANTANVEPTDRLIVYTGYLYMSVENPEDTRGEIQALVDEFSSRGAFIVSANQSGSGSSLYVSMSIRVPSEHFASIMEDMAGMGVEVHERNENASDVTAEYVDLENRIESMEAARDRLLEIMKDADTTEDLLYAEQQLTYRETEIESLKGRLKFLASSASLSRIDITLNPYIVSQPIDTNWNPMKAVRYAIDELIYNAQDFVEFLIGFVIVGIPALVMWIVVLWVAWIVVRFVWRRTFGRTQKEDAAPEETNASE